MTNEKNVGTLTFGPLIPAAVWLTLAVAGVALLAWYGWRRPPAITARRWAGILVLHAAGLLLVLLILLNPTWVRPATPPAGKPLLTVLIDATASMATADVEGHSRYQSAVGLARACADKLGERFELRVRTFAGSPSSVELTDLEKIKPEGQITDLAAALSGSLQEDRPQGQTLLLVSDGIHNGGGGAARVLDAARVAKALACPVHTRTVGGDAEVKDLAVEIRSPQELSFVGQKVSVSVLLRQRGLAGALATLTLTLDGKEVERRQVALAASGTTEARFEINQKKEGLYRYELRAEPLPGELSLVNNSATLVLRVVNDPVRVLLLEGKPYWDGKFLMRTFLLDPSIDLDSVVRVSEGRLHRRTLTRSRVQDLSRDRQGAEGSSVREDWKVLTKFSEVLAKGDGLKSYQIVVLGRDAEVFLTEPVLEQLRTWVLRDGGSLVCYRGQPVAQVDQRLAQMLPLRWAPARESRFLLTLTERGREMRWLPADAESPGATFTGLPTLATAARPEQVKPLAVVLATSGSSAAGADVAQVAQPAVTYQPYGMGRVVVIEGSGMWRWAFLPPGQQQHDEVYRALWHSLLHWLASSADLLPGQKLALRTDKVRFGTGEPATATLLLREETAPRQAPQVELRGEGVPQVAQLDAPKTIVPVAQGDEPGTFRVAFGRLPEGRYTARVVGSPAGDSQASTTFDVRNFSDEQLDLQARPDLMARIARESGGSVLESGTPAEIVAQLQAQLDRARPFQVYKFPAWDRWWVLLGVIVVWGAAWALRRSGGLT